MPFIFSYDRFAGEMSTLVFISPTVVVFTIRFLLELGMILHKLPSTNKFLSLTDSTKEPYQILDLTMVKILLARTGSTVEGAVGGTTGDGFTGCV